MTIEFHTPKTKVKEWILTFLMKRMVHLYDRDRSISKAEIYLRELEGGQKSCAIDLTVHGHSHFFHRKSFSFEEAALHVLYQMEEKLRNRQVPAFRV